MFRRVGKRIRNSYVHPIPMKIKEWATKNVVFKDSSVSPIPGKFKLENSAHMELVFDTLDRKEVTEVYCKFASQLGKSLITMIYAGHKLDQSPAYIGYFVPVENNLSRIIQTKINPVLKSMPRIWKKFTDYRMDKDEDDASQRGRSKQTMKLCAGGGLLISGSSTSNRKSVTIQSIIFDECGEMNNGIVEETSERIKTYLKFFPKVLAVSTIVNPNDAIVSSYDRAECQMEYHFVCPECENTFYPSSFTFSYPKKSDYEDIEYSEYIRKAEDEAAIICPHCSYAIKENERQKLLYAGFGMKWVAVKGDYKKARTIGFSANSLHSAFVPLGEVAKKLIKINDSPTADVDLEIFYRGWFNEFYSADEDEKTDAEEVVQFAGYDIDILTVPDNTVAVYLGVDTQKDHFWCKVSAFTEGGDSVDIFVGRLETYGDIVDLMDTTLKYSDGRKYKEGIRRTAIDLGGYVETETVYDEKTGAQKSIILKNVPEETKLFVLEQAELRGLNGEYESIYGVRGYDYLSNESMYMMASQQVKIESWKSERTFKYIKMGANSAKLSFLSRLNRAIYDYEGAQARISQKILDTYAGEHDRYHIAHQLTSEIYTWSDKKKKRKTFEKIKKQNHFLDCSAMIEVLANMDRAHLMKPKKYTDDSIKKDLKSIFVL